MWNNFVLQKIKLKDFRYFIRLSAGHFSGATFNTHDFFQTLKLLLQEQQNCHRKKSFNLKVINLHQFYLETSHSNSNFTPVIWKIDRFKHYIENEIAVPKIFSAQICGNSRHERMSFSISYIFYKICKSASQCRATFSPPESFRKRLSFHCYSPSRTRCTLFYILSFKSYFLFPPRLTYNFIKNEKRTSILIV